MRWPWWKRKAETRNRTLLSGNGCSVEFVQRGYEMVVVVAAVVERRGIVGQTVAMVEQRRHRQSLDVEIVRRGYLESPQAGC